MTVEGSNWQAIAQQRRIHRQQTISEIVPIVPAIPENIPRNVTALPRQLLPAEVIAITETSTEELLAVLASGKLSSTAVAKAYLQRAGLASRLANCATELLPGRALERAEYLDKYLQRNKKPLGPLHGLPISVKEHIGIKDLDLNGAYVSWVGRVAKDDAQILKLLWNAGCVFYVRTTQPQALMHLETDSNIFGVTPCPYNTALSAGGSSGGEGALLALRGSCLGIGSDIGGSIRNPAANNGVFGLRPTSYRLSIAGSVAPGAGEEQVIAVVGPLSTSLRGINVFMKTIIDQKPWLYDAMMVPLPWQNPFSGSTSLLRKNVQGQRQLRIGILQDDGVVRPHPPILRALDTLTSKLAKNRNIELIEFPPYKHDEAWRLISSLYFADGGAAQTEAIDASGEPWLPLTEFILKHPNVKPRTVSEVWALTVERDQYRSAYTQHWNSVGTDLPGPETGCQDFNAANRSDDFVDVVLCPVGPGCATPHDTAKYWSYTSQWNLLDYPALTFPTGLNVSPEDQADMSYLPRNADDEYNHRLYTPDTYLDAPICLQLVGRRYEDEKVIEACDMLLKSLEDTHD